MSESDTPEPGRRAFIRYAAMVTGLVTSFGGAVAIAARYIYPREGIRRVRQIFLAPVRDIPEGEGRVYGLPTGGTALVTNTGEQVVALSNVCPHLGCKVHWEKERKEFFCPCHGGVFDPEGRAVAGPPADEGKDLTRYPIEKVGDNLFIQIEEIVRS